MRRCEEIPKRATGQGVGMGCPHISPQLKHGVEALSADGTCWSVARLGLVCRLHGLSMCPYLLWIGESGSAAISAVWLPGQGEDTTIRDVRCYRPNELPGEAATGLDCLRIRWNGCSEQLAGYRLIRVP